MSEKRRFSGVGAVLFTALIVGGHPFQRVALAGPLEPTLGRLVEDPECPGDRSRWPCRPDQAAFHKLVSQWGGAIAPVAGGAARSLGSQGLELGIQATATTIESSADYWQRGARGGGSQAQPNVLDQYSLNVTKGYGFGLQTTGSLGVVPGTPLIVWGLEFREAPFEGLQAATSRYLPDVSVGAGVRKITGFGELSLFTVSVDARVSYRVLLGDRNWLSPWLGGQWVRIAGDSALLDFTPGIDAVAECGYVGEGDMLTVQSPSNDNCPGSSADAANTRKFATSVVYRDRIVAGIDFRREQVKVGVAVATDVVPPSQAQTRADVASALGCNGDESNCDPAPRQWTLSLDVGVTF